MEHKKLNLVAALVAAALGTSLVGCAHSPSIDPSQQEIIKSQNDQRQYRYLELENGLRVVLVSDHKADKAAASLDVHIGHMADPKGREGLSHFLEHMLFLGTKKYPKVGEYNEYLKENGGWSNAGTGQEHTNYFFEVNEDALDEALDRFAQFFISPTLDPQYVEREKNAVDSEYNMKIKDDARRIREVLKDTSNQAHPASQFSVGNLDTLADREGSLLIDDLKQQYQTYYSASRMALSVVAKDDLDTLEASVRAKFSQVPTNGTVSSPSQMTPFLPEQLGVKINIEPMKDTRALTLYFPVPTSQQYFKEKPLTLISDLLANEGAGSLYSYLKHKGFIESLNSYYYGPDDFEQFTVTMTLTELGLAQHEEVTQAMFSYLRLIAEQGLKPLYFDELKAIAKTNFDFQEKYSAANTARSISSQLQYFAPKYVLSSDYIYERFSADLVKEYLAYLTPENMRQVLIAKGLETNKIQPEYQTPYAMVSLTAQQLKFYQSDEINPAFALPKANPFIAKNLTMKPLDAGNAIPEVIFEQHGFKLWHKQDSEFLVPKASINVQIYSDLAGQDASSRAKNFLYNALLKDSLNEFGYPAKQAGLNYNLWSTNQGMGFGVNGYDEKQVDLLTTINQRVRNLNIDPAAFELHKNRLIRTWGNAKFNRPYSQGLSVLREIQRNQMYSPEQLAGALSDVTIAQLQSYIQAFHQEIEVEVLAHGNIQRVESLDLAKRLYQFNMADATPKLRAVKEVRVNNSNDALIRELDIDHPDSSLIMSYINPDKSLQTKAHYALLGNIINAPFFKSIRTELQLGYIVAGRATTLDELSGLYFLIQSPKEGPVQLQRRVEQFFASFKLELEQMTPQQYDDFKQGLIKDLSAKDKNLNERTAHYWSEINAKAVNFDSDEQLITYVKALKQDDLIPLFEIATQTVKPFIVRSFGQVHRDSDDFKVSENRYDICRQSGCFASGLTRSIKM